MDKLNVCLINDSFPPTIDGVANAVTNYAQIISQKYGRAAVVTPFYPDADDSAFAFPVIRYPSVDMTKAVGYRAGIPFSPEVMNRLKGESFNLIHSHCPITSTILARALRDRIHVPLVFTYHTKFDIDIANAVKSRLLREEAARLLVENISACDEVWTVSRGAGENLRKLGYQGDYLVMPNGVDFPRGRVPDGLVAQVTQDYDLPAGLPVFLFVGRMMWYKGIRIILDALKTMMDSGRDFRMVFVGAGNDKEEICAYSSALGLDAKVFFAPAIHDRNLIRAWYCRADLFLFPSSFDTNGLVVREAAACALPSVLVAGSCAAENVQDGVNGFLMEENAASMAAKLQRLCDAPELIKRVGENAERDLYLSWDSSVAAAVDRYQTVIYNDKRGLYPRHERFSDEMCHAAAKAMEDLYRGRERQRNAVSGAKSGLQEMRVEIAESREKVRERLDELTQRFDRFL